ncbi:MAG TPA: alpha/beta hydrolase [Bradyrhizobium sp.]|nr:alpha/beta hydrolase [Bradyrhizobium sp.]
MVAAGLIAMMLLLLAVITQAGVLIVQRRYPTQGIRVEVAGAVLNLLDIGRADAASVPIVLIHGASSNMETMRPLSDTLAKRHRVVLIDRPGLGWSMRARERDSTPAIQGRMIREALAKVGISSAILVVHSWAGALGARMALDYSDGIAGLVMLAPVTHPWRGGVGWYNHVVTAPVIGRLLAYTIMPPLGWVLAAPSARQVFLPQVMPDEFVQDSATALLLRPRTFLANARDLVTLKSAVAAQAPRYRDIKAPTVVISGDIDKTVSTEIHSRPFVAVVPSARLIVLPGVGHMVQYAAPDIVLREIEAMAAQVRA